MLLVANYKKHFIVLATYVRIEILFRVNSVAAT